MRLNLWMNQPCAFLISRYRSTEIILISFISINSTILIWPIAMQYLSMANVCCSLRWGRFGFMAFVLIAWDCFRILCKNGRKIKLFIAANIFNTCTTYRLNLKANEPITTTNRVKKKKANWINRNGNRWIRKTCSIIFFVFSFVATRSPARCIVFYFMFYLFAHFKSCIPNSVLNDLMTLCVCDFFIYSYCGLRAFGHFRCEFQATANSGHVHNRVVSVALTYWLAAIWWPCAAYVG